MSLLHSLSFLLHLKKPANIQFANHSMSLPPSLNCEDIARENASFEDFANRLKAFTFTHKHRNLLFGSEQTEERNKLIFEISHGIISIKNKATKLRSKTTVYRRAVERYDFVQKKSRPMTLKHNHDAITNYSSIIASCGDLLLFFEKLKTEEGNLRKLFHKIKKELALIVDRFHENEVKILDIMGRIQIENNLVSEYKELEKYLLDRNSLQTGDILISFKSKKYFENATRFAGFTSKFVSHLGNTDVTHAAMVLKTHVHLD